MARKLIIFNDHSWIKAQHRSKRRAVSGNATLAHQCLEQMSEVGPKQISLLQNEFQDCGVFSRTIRRMFGVGIRGEILSAYQFLAHNYMPGDEIYLIGAGRGAFSLQCLAEMLSISGLLLAESIDDISNAYTYSSLTEEARHNPSGQDLRESFESRQVRIKFMGCWDTVGAAGVPVKSVQSLSRLWTEFHSGKVSDNVDVACQALALDETNPAFAPHIWTGTKSSNLVKLQQVWFSGKHNNVTGGQRDSGLSDIAFRWLIKEASAQGLRFDTDKIKGLTTPDHMGRITNETPFAAFSRRLFNRAYQRPVGIADSYLSREQVPGTEKVHETVKKREMSDETYNPQALSVLPPGTLPICEENTPHIQSDRRYERLQVNCPATLYIANNRFNGNMLDFSPAGARIWMPLDLQIGTPLTLRSSLLFEDEKEGHVVWTDEQAVGVEFSREISLTDLRKPPNQAFQ